MTLETYRQKRDFERTPEPKGEEQPSVKHDQFRFVVQKHKASQLHYDLRLQHAGVLLSWAVPKGPSLNSKDKRLAIKVEDHPIEYGGFEGIIPKGDYGAGTVMVWDTGDYQVPGATSPEETERLFNYGLNKGHITVILHGSKLQGEFALIKFHNAEENAWLLIKAGDEFDGATITDEDHSALSGKTMQEITEQSASSGDIWLPRPDAGTLPDLNGIPSSPVLSDVKPMLATSIEEPFDREGWLFEVKWDGYRAIAKIGEGNLHLYSRNQQTLNAQYPEIIESLSRLNFSAVLDGEIVVLDEAGVSQFGLLQDYQQQLTGALAYYVFDILWLEGHDLRGLPLARRKEILTRVLPVLPHVRLSQHIETSGVEFFKLAIAHGLEGIIAKDMQSHYRAGERSRDWLKIKIFQQQEAVIGGYTEPRGSRQHLGALVLGVYKDDELVYIGHTGGGSDEALLAKLQERLAPLERETSPFAKPPKTNAPVHWVEPKLHCDVSFAGWTKDGMMREPILKGLHESTNASKKHAAEQPLPATQPDGKLHLSNMQKIYWPEDGYSKGDLIAYYRDIASFILPHLKDRPESLHRFPHGITGESFYQKNVEDAPEWVQSVQIQTDAEARKINYLLCQDEDTLCYLANLGCIEMNPWLSRIQALENPDFLVLDLDPEDIAFEKVVETALAVRKVVSEAGITCYAKTSGATGMHIYVPLGAQYPYDLARNFAELVARIVNSRLPDITSVVRSPSKRQKRVYVDYLQNHHGQTVASPYSVRPHPGAPVSAPLLWEEVNAKLDPEKFTIKTMSKRLEKLGDLFAPVLANGNDLAAGLEKLNNSGK